MESNNNKEPGGRDQEGENLHDAALLMVMLNEERRALEDQQRQEERVAQEEDKQTFLEERRNFTARIKGEALIFANQVRKVKIMDEIQATKEKDSTIWKRIKTLIGWD